LAEVNAPFGASGLAPMEPQMLRIGSPPCGSTFTTSAPQSASTPQAAGPAIQ
jgi:hypothetical protein